MQEIDPAFNEKDLGFSRFSKFVIEAAHKGLITLTKLDNGQYEIGLGPGVPGAAAQPAGLATFDRPRERERGEGRGRGRRGRGGRAERGAPEEPAPADDPAARPPDPAAVTDADEALDPPMPESSAPPSMRPANAPVAGIPSRSARFRRGSRGPRVAPPDIPKIGVVEMDPNFKPRIELVPPKLPPPPAPAAPEPFGGDSVPAGGGGAERGARGRGGRGGRDRKSGGEGKRGDLGGRRI